MGRRLVQRLRPPDAAGLRASTGRRSRIVGVSSTSARGHGKAFDDVAADYDRHRPAYPDELVDRACQLAGIGSGDRVLEIGCGSGQLTRGLVARGLHVTALEPGKHLLALAGQNAVRDREGPGTVEFVNARFEDAELPREHFRAVFSASAFHWIDPEVGWEKAACVLRPGGMLSLLQYFGLQEECSLSDQKELLSALARIAPEIAAEWPTYRDLAGTVAGAQQRRANVSDVWAWLGSHHVARARAGDLFGDVRIAAVPMLLEQAADEVNALLRTASFYARLSQDQRQALESETVAIHERLGRRIRSSTVAVLVTARRSNP
jgi:ubiquinone/menaquinone biosynthesis C-methylase UbiE